MTRAKSLSIITSAINDSLGGVSEETSEILSIILVYQLDPSRAFVVLFKSVKSKPLHFSHRYSVFIFNHPTWIMKYCALSIISNQLSHFSY